MTEPAATTASPAQGADSGAEHGGGHGADSGAEHGAEHGGGGHGTKAVLAALIANLGIAISKFVAFLITGATSMLAEAIHSVADSGNQVLLLVGGRRAKRAATADHPFGYARERYIYAFLVSVVLFSVGGCFALYEAYHKWHEVRAGHLEDPMDNRWWWVPLVVLGVAIVLESFSLRTAVRESNPLREGRSWVAFIKESRAPELPVILLEDCAALIGLFLALLGVALTLLTGSYYFDVAGAATIGILLICVAVILAIETRSMLLGEGGTREAVRRIRTALDATPGITRVIHLRTLHLGPDELLVAAKIAIAHDQTAASVAAVINDAEARVRSAERSALTIYLEPDLDSASVEPGSHAY